MAHDLMNLTISTIAAVIGPVATTVVGTPSALQRETGSVSEEIYAMRLYIPCFAFLQKVCLVTLDVVTGAVAALSAGFFLAFGSWVSLFSGQHQFAFLIVLPSLLPGLLLTAAAAI